ncbi:MAG: hypothetical protein CMP20_09250 [Rickettsiales bacterium]|nr:hypothetical protein [Rickettsiales bacterium]
MSAINWHSYSSASVYSDCLQGRAHRHKDYICEGACENAFDPLWVYVCLFKGFVTKKGEAFLSGQAKKASVEEYFANVTNDWTDQAISLLAGFVDCDENSFEPICRILNRETNPLLDARIACAMIVKCVSDPRENQLLRDLVMAHEYKKQLVGAFNNWRSLPPPDYED